MSEVNLTKTCSSCGLQKPLNAFLEMTDHHQISYGNICAACRKTQLENPEEEEATKSTVELKLDLKAKIQAEINAEITQKKIEDERIEDNQLKEKKHEEEVAKEAIHSSDEKKHRSAFMEKSPLLDSKAAQANAEKMVGGETQKAKAGAVVYDPRAPMEDSRHGEGTVKKQSAHYQEYLSRNPGLEIKKSANYQSYLSWMGASSPLVKAFQQFQQSQGVPTKRADAPAVTATEAAAKKASAQHAQKFSLATPVAETTNAPETPGNKSKFRKGI